LFCFSRPKRTLTKNKRKIGEKTKTGTDYKSATISRIYMINTIYTRNFPLLNGEKKSKLDARKVKLSEVEEKKLRARRKIRSNEQHIVIIKKNYFTLLYCIMCVAFMSFWLKFSSLLFTPPPMKIYY
jgi:hypothetical protein